VRARRRARLSSCMRSAGGAGRTTLLSASACRSCMCRCSELARGACSAVGVGLMRGLGWLPAPGAAAPLSGTTALLVGGGNGHRPGARPGERGANMCRTGRSGSTRISLGSPRCPRRACSHRSSRRCSEIVFRACSMRPSRRRRADPATLSAAVFALAHGYGARLAGVPERTAVGDRLRATGSLLRTRRAPRQQRGAASACCG